MRNGWNPFVSKYNTNYPAIVQDVGGIERLVRTNVGRNMWRIMSKFNVLPNDPRLQTLSVAARDFVLLSMKEDQQEQRRAALGLESEGAGYSDKEMEKLYDAPEEEFTVVHGDQDPEKIFKQVQQLTADPEYEMRAQQALDRVYQNQLPAQAKKLRDLDEYQAAKIEEARQLSAQKEQAQREQQEQLDFQKASWINDDGEDWDDYRL